MAARHHQSPWHVGVLRGGVPLGGHVLASHWPLAGQRVGGWAGSAPLARGFSLWCRARRPGFLRPSIASLGQRQIGARVDGVIGGSGGNSAANRGAGCQRSARRHHPAPDCRRLERRRVVPPAPFSRPNASTRVIETPGDALANVARNRRRPSLPAGPSRGSVGRAAPRRDGGTRHAARYRRDDRRWPGGVGLFRLVRNARHERSPGFRRLDATSNGMAPGRAGSADRSAHAGLGRVASKIEVAVRGAAL